MKKIIFLLALVLGMSSCFNDHKDDPQPQSATQTVLVTNQIDTSVTSLKNSTWIAANECGNGYSGTCSLDTSLFTNPTYSFVFYKFTNDSLFVSTTSPYNNYADTVQAGKYLMTDFFDKGYSKVYQKSEVVETWSSNSFSIKLTDSQSNTNVKWFVKRK